MKAQAFIGKVTDVHPHPEIVGLDVVTISGKVNIANREPGMPGPRYEVGDFAVMLTENMILPEWLLERLGMWDFNKNKGTCSGSKGNRLKSRRIPNKEGGIISEVALLPASFTRGPDTTYDDFLHQEGTICFDADDIVPMTIIIKVVMGGPDISPEGTDVAWNLGIEEIYQPPLEGLS